MSTVDDFTIKAAGRGDREAQALVLRSMQDDWFRFCRAQLRDPHRAEDATQETAIRVLKSLQTFEGRSSFKTWTFGIALNVCREARRKNFRHAGSDLSDAFDATTKDDRADAIESDEEVSALRSLLTTLPERQREVVTLRYLQALSVSETAQAMECAEGTVKATLFTALRTLRAKMLKARA